MPPRGAAAYKSGAMVIKQRAAQVPDGPDFEITELTPQPTIRQLGIPIEKIVALRARGLSYQQIADICGCDKSNVIRRLQSVSGYIDNVGLYKDNRADVLAVKQMILLDQITPAKAQLASVKDLAISTAILFDKERMERGQSVINISYSDASKRLEQIRADKERIQAEIEALEGGIPLDVVSVSDSEP